MAGDAALQVREGAALAVDLQEVWPYLLQVFTAPFDALQSSIAYGGERKRQLWHDEHPWRCSG
jgi:hypothetical protein